MDAIDDLLSVQDLRVTFHTETGAAPALDGVTFSVGRGRTLALVGESGCGKSVCALSIMRLLRPPGRIEAGTVHLHLREGERYDITALDEGAPALYRIRGGLIGMVFQEPMTALSPVHTVADQVGEVLVLHRDLTKKQARGQVAAMLAEVGIPAPERCLDRYPFELSGGMRQRVVIAMALVAGPQLLIADEPTTALDVTIQAQVLRLINALKSQRRMSVLFITHDLGVVAQVADEVAVMYCGRIVEYGPVREVLKRPGHPYTRALLRSLPGLHRRGERLQSIDGSVPGPGDMPPGCSFHPRCARFRPGPCNGPNPPDPEALGEGHWAACVRAREVDAL